MVRASRIRSLRIFAIVTLVTGSAFAQPREIRRSLCPINNTAQEFNCRTRLLPGQMSGGNVTGRVGAKDRLMTNPHVVLNARLLTVEMENDPKKFVGTLEFPRPVLSWPRK